MWLLLVVGGIDHRNHDHWCWMLVVLIARNVVIVAIVGFSVMFPQKVIVIAGWWDPTVLCILQRDLTGLDVL
jgi:hypothetical protein